MNPDTTPTPRTDSVSVEDTYGDGEIVLASFSRKLERELIEQTNEVARLRELLYRAIEIADNYEIAGLPRDGFMLHWKVNKHEFSMLKEKIRLSPAPEEPVSIPTDLNQHYKANTLSLNEWRELGADEVICSGDEEWHPARDSWIARGSFGDKPSDYNPIFRFRTRRPLPKQEEMPLAKMMECFLGDYPDAGKAIYDAIYNLRDEIQKLKEALEYKEDRKTPPPSWFKKNKKVFLK